MKLRICSQCGEEWIDDAAARRLEQVVNEARLQHREVEVTAFAQAPGRGRPAVAHCCTGSGQLPPAAVRAAGTAARRQLAMVLAMSMAMVMGPTPPGTGVMARHFGATSAKATSPVSL